MIYFKLTITLLSALGVWHNLYCVNDPSRDKPALPSTYAIAAIMKVALIVWIWLVL